MALLGRQRDSRSPNQRDVPNWYVCSFQGAGHGDAFHNKGAIESLRFLYVCKKVQENFLQVWEGPRGRSPGALGHKVNLLMLSAICISRYW